MITRVPKHLTNGRPAAFRLATPVSSEKVVPQFSKAKAWVLLLAVFIAVHVASLFTPSLLDDADAAHAQVARHIAVSGDWVTFQINGIRYLEKAPLPYWLVAIDYRLFGFNVFATHLPMTLAILGCSMLAWHWARRAYGERAALYASLGVLTAAGIFLFTRIYIPEALLTLLTALALYCLLTGLEDRSPAKIYAMWAALALGLLTKGLLTPVFFAAAALPYLLITGTWRRWRELRPLTGVLLFLAIGAPWHILAGLQNPDQGHPVGNIPSPGNVHGFFYFYFVNEHLLRFLGTRYPHDYNKLPGYLYWSLHLIWLAPWSIFLPVVLRRAWQTRHQWLNDLRPNTAQTVDYYIERAHLVDPASHVAQVKFRARSNWLLAFYAAFILLFFSISTNQEYYTFPAYFPMLLLTAGALARAEEYPGTPRGWLNACHAIFAAFGVVVAAALAYGLWLARGLPFVPDVGTLLAHRDVAGYTFSMSHFLDLTGPSFAALREPAAIAAPAGAGSSAGPRGGRLPRRPARRLAATEARTPSRGDHLRRLHRRGLPGCGPYCAGPLRTDPLLEGHRRHDQPLRATPGPALALRRPVRRVLDHFLYRSSRPVGGWPTKHAAMGVLLPRCAPHLPQRRRPASNVGQRSTQFSLRSGRFAEPCRIAPRHSCARDPTTGRQDSLHRSTAAALRDGWADA